MNANHRFQWLVTALVFPLGAMVAPQTGAATAAPCADSSPATDIDIGRQRAEAKRNRQRDISQRLYRLQKFGDSLVAARRVVEFTRELVSPDAVELADDLRWEVLVLMDLGHFKEAGDGMREIVQIREAHAKDQPNEVVDARVYLRYIERVSKMSATELANLRRSMDLIAEAGRLDQVGKVQEAIGLADQGLALRRETVGYEDKVYLDNLGVHALRLSKASATAEAIKTIDAALAGFRELFGEQHRWYASAMNAKAEIFEAANKSDEALVCRQTATGIYLKSLGSSQQVSRRSVEMLGHALEATAEKRRAAGDFKGAAAACDEQASLYEASFGSASWQRREALASAEDCRRLEKLDEGEQQDVTAALARVEAILHAAKIDGPVVATRQFNEPLQTLRRLLGENSWIVLETEARLATLLLQMPDAQAAEACLTRVYQLRRELLGPEAPQTKEVLESMRDVLDTRAANARDVGDFKEAEAVLSDELKWTVDGYGADDWRSINTRCDLDELRRTAVFTPEQRRLLDEAQQAYHRSSDLQRQGRYVEAAESMSRSLKIREPIWGDSRVTAYCHHALGHLYDAAGDYAQAEQHLQKALQLRERYLGKSHPKYAETLHNWATWKFHVRDYGGAVAAYREALGIIRRTLGAESETHVRSAVGLAMAYSEGFRNLAEAEPLLQEALVACQRKDFADPSLHARVLNNLAGIYAHMDRLELAEELFLQAAEIWKKTKDRVDYAMAIDNASKFAITRGDLTAAARMQRDALKIFKQHLGPNHPQTLVCLANCAMTALVRKRSEEAKGYAKEALSAAGQQFAASAETMPEEHGLRAYHDLRRSLDVMLQVTAPTRSADEAMWHEVLKWKGAVSFQQVNLRVAASEKQFEPFVARLRDATSRLASVAVHPPASDDLDEWQARVGNLAGERRTCERELLQAIRESEGRRVVAPSAEALAAAIPMECALVDYFAYGTAELRKSEENEHDYDWRTEMRLAAFIVRAGRDVVRVELGPTATVAEAIEAWHNVYTRPGPVHDRDGVAGTLSGLIWRPIEEYLGTATTLLIAPDGPLGKVAFSALPGKQEGHYLIDEYVIAQLPVPQLMLAPAPRADRTDDSVAPGLLLVGDVKFEREQGRNDGERTERLHFSELPGSREEIAAVKRLYCKHFVGSEPCELTKEVATETAVRQALPTRRISLLATHGFYAPGDMKRDLAWTQETRGLALQTDLGRHLGEGEVFVHPGLLSGIALAGAGTYSSEQDNPAADDGILTALEVSGLDLRNTRLAVLSACDTALGQTISGEGLLGLQRAFLVAGARTTVSSLWPVSDRATEPLMVRFFDELWSEMAPSPMTALRNAQHWMAHDAAARAALVQTNLNLPADSPLPPYYWAGFVVCGDWR